MHVAIKENKYIATKYLDQRQDQDVLPSLCLSENREQSKRIHHGSEITPEYSLKE